ncbi:TonB-dependent receptor [Hydrogenovibrio thermophilus]|uniref:TonB-dependent receptor n=2 Tax=Hydrogenovibrio thermophilus TaxID=265883 RepID=A0A451G4J1_9GAMM|nr:TonB-dependent receptor [Hydrogenovibrio thermophilus]
MMKFNQCTRSFFHKTAVRTGGLMFPVICLSAFSQAVWAEPTKSSDETSLETVQVTTATKTPRRLDEVPVQTTVVTRDDIEKTHAQNLAEALKYVPGVQLKPIHGKTGEGVWIQGFDPDRVLILVDGNPVSPSTGSTVDVTQVAIGDVERIEIIKGATSALYGTSAMGGVVNVITREPTANFRVSADVSGGNWGEQSEKDNPLAKKHGNFEVSTKQDKWYGQVIADLTESDGFKAPDTAGESTQGWNGHKNTVSGKFQYAFDNDLKVTLMPRYFDEDAATLEDVAVPGFGNRTEEYRDKTQVTNIATVVEQRLKNDWNWKIRAMWEGFDNDSNKASHRKTFTDHSEAAAQLDMPLGDSHLVTVGAEFQYDYMDVKNLSTGTQEVADETKESTSVFAQDSWFVTPNLEVLPGARFHNDSRDGSHLAPMLNAMYSRQDWLPGRVNIRAGVGNGYRTPNLKELYYLFDHSQLGYVVQGNKDLKPESSISYQLGLEWVFPDDGSLGVSLFHNDIDDLIAEALNPNKVGPNGAAVYEYQNIEKAMTEGVEVVFRKPLGSYFRLDASYNYLNARDVDTKKVLVERPEHEAKLGLDTYLWKVVTVTVKMNYESDQYLDEANDTVSPGYTTWDAIVNYDINQDWRLYGGVNNVTDVQRKFDGTDFRPEAGRYVYLGVRFQYED